MLKYITGRAYKPPTAETVLDYSGDEMPPATRRKRSKEREQAQRERRKTERDAENKSAVSTRSSKSSHSSRGDDALREEKRRERRERKNRDRDCTSSVSTSSASRVSKRTGGMVVKLSDGESIKAQAQPATATISTAHAITGRKRSPTMPTTLPTMRALDSEERDRSQTPRPIRGQRSDPTLQVSTKPEGPSVEPVPITTPPLLPLSKPAHVAAPAPAIPVARARTASPGFGQQFPPPTHCIATPQHTPDSKTPMPVPETVATQQFPPTPDVRRAHRPHIRTSSEVRFASPVADGTRTPRSGWRPPQHRHHSEGYEQGYCPQLYYQQDSNGRHKGELPPPPDYLYRQQRPQSATGYYHQQAYYPQTHALPSACHGQALSLQSPPESAKSQPLPERERDTLTRSSSTKPIRHSLPPPPTSHDYYSYYPYHAFAPPSQIPSLVHHVPRYPPPPPTAADIEFLGPAAKRERKRRHSMHYPSSSPYEPQHAQYLHHSRVMTPVEGISPTSRPFHDFPPPGRRLVPPRLALSSGSSGDSSSHRLPPPPEFTPNGSRHIVRYMDEAGEEAGEQKVRSLEFDNETTVTSMVAVSAEYPTREKRLAMQRFVGRRGPEEVENMAVVGAMKEEEEGEKMERGQSIASGSSATSGVPLPPPAIAAVEIERKKFEVERPRLLPPAEFCEEAPVFEEEEDEVVEQVVNETEEITEKDMPIVEAVVPMEVPLPNAPETDTREELEQQVIFGKSEEDKGENDEAEEEELQEEEEDGEEEEEDCDTVVGLGPEGYEEIAGTGMIMEGVSIMNGRLESVKECHNEGEEEEEEGSDLEEDEEEEEAEEEEAEHDQDEGVMHEPHIEEHQQATSSTHSCSDLGVRIDHSDEEHDQTAEGFLANLDNSSPPASSIFSTPSAATTLDSMFPSTTQSSASSAPNTNTSTDYPSGSSSASYTPQYMPAVFAYAPSPPPSTDMSSTDYTCSTTNSSATTQYPMKNPHMMGMGIGIPHSPPRTQPGTRISSPLLYKRTPVFPQQTGMLPMTLTEPQAFPRFTSLNLRLLRHLENELVELERMLEEFEARMVNEVSQIRPGNVAYHHVNGASPYGSVRSRMDSGYSVSSSMPGEIGDMEAKRAEIMDALAWKLGQYNQALVNYQTMMDTFRPVLNPCPSATTLRRPASRDSGVASSRGSSGVRLSDRDAMSEHATGDYGGDCYESIPGGWGTKEQEHKHELSQAAAETKPADEAQEKDPETAAEDACMPHAQDIDIVLTGEQPPGHSRKRSGYNRSASSASTHPTYCSSCHPSSTTCTLSPPSHSLPTSSPKRSEPTLKEILAPPFLLLAVLYSLEWISSWGKILGLVMVFGVGRALRRGVEKEEEWSEVGRGRSGVRRERCGVGV
ncbi:hypothetical protein EV426DRAFT_113291 [Tirmania nivea]|nr:hypothetical protein EV426DRAFT_113291 [Tirmania nivea]